MSLTTLDPVTALVVVDLQAGSAAAPSAQPFADIVANAATLAEAFRARGLPVVLVNAAGVTQVVIAGHATGFGVECTARHAHALGFHVTLAVDDMTDPDPSAHRNAVGTIFPMLGETGTTADVVGLLAG